MKLDRVIVSADEDSAYVDFWPVIARTWRRVVGLPCTLAYVGTPDPDLRRHGEVRCFERTGAAPISTLAQVVRMYAASLFEDEVCLISDIDMLPLQRSYFVDSVRDVPDDHVAIYSADAYRNGDEGYPMCYNAAKGRVFRELLDAGCDWATYVERVVAWSRANPAPVGSGDVPPLWFTDERWFGQRIRANRVRYRLLSRGFRPLARDRIDRASWRYDLGALRRGGYIDCHALRPYAEHAAEVDFVAGNAALPR